MAKMNMRGFERLVEKKVRKVMGTVTTHRVYVKDLTITASTNKYINLLNADDDPDYDLVSNGTNTAECHTNSKITKIQLSMQYFNSTGSGLTVEWMLTRRPDVGGIATTDMTPANLWVSDWNVATNALKANTVTYGHSIISSTFETVKSSVRIKRKALGRIRTMHDGDLLTFALFPPAGTTQVLNLIGRIWTVHA